MLFRVWEKSITVTPKSYFSSSKSALFRRRRVLVIGAGAAGSMAAIFAAAAGAETLLLETTQDGGRKILISGGGRCNILPAQLDESRFVTDSSPNTARKIVRSWPLHEQIAFFERELGLPLVKEEGSGKLFPASQCARDVRDGLLMRGARKGVKFMPCSRVTGFTPQPGSWRVEREGGAPLEADAIVLATGGLSVPKTGSDGKGLSILGKLGLTIHPTYAALTPLTAKTSPYRDLAGVSLQVRITASDEARKATAIGGLLFTHCGYSGPAVLDISHVAVRSLAEGRSPARLSVSWTSLESGEWDALLRTAGAGSVAGVLRRELPERLAERLLKIANIEPACRLARLRREERRRLVETLVRCDLPWSGVEGYQKAEVTGGGVSLSEINPLTMESRRYPGLFLCGELLDAFGPIGGYNFLWAWVTGRAAGLAAAGRE
jgi:predicted Rossmann fold flavoprotein